MADEFVARFLETGVATVDDIDSLIQSRAREGAQLEYKGGDWLSGKGAATPGHPVKPGPRLCSYVAGFANGVGGVLLVGIDEKKGDKDAPGQVNKETCGSVAASAEDLQGKARDWLRRVAQQLAFPPRIAVVEHPKGLVLVVGVDRAPNWIECAEPGAVPAYYLRTYDGTSKLLDPVASDLLVGRRERPQLDLRVTANQGNAGPQGVHVHLSFEVIIAGLVWLQSLRAGVVYPNERGHSPLPAHMRSSLEVPSDQGVAHVEAQEANYTWGELAPFGKAVAGATIGLRGARGEWCAAVYVVAPGHPPSWWELRGWIETNGGIRLHGEVSAETCRGRRARVGYGDDG